MIKTSKAKINQLSSSLVKIDFFHDQEVDVDDRLEIISALESLYKDQKFSLLILAGERNKLTPEARKFDMNERVEKFVDREALVIQSLSTRLSATFYYKLRKPNFEVRVFSNEVDAKKWLEDRSVNKGRVING